MGKALFMIKRLTMRSLLLGGAKEIIYSQVTVTYDRKS